MAELKTKPTRASVAKFIATVEDDTKRADCEALGELMREAVGAGPRMWGTSIVGFGLQSYHYASGRSGEWFIAGFAPRKRNLVVYLTQGYEEHGDLLAKLGRHSTGKSCLYLRRLSDIDLPTFKTLIARSVASVEHPVADAG